MEYDELLKVTNHSDKRLRFRYAGRPHYVLPKSESLIPFDAIVLRLGDPRSGPYAARVEEEQTGKVLRIPSRASEIKRLSVKYGVYDTTLGGVEKIKAVMPDVTVTNMDSNDPIVFPLDDPECIQFVPVDVDKSQMAMMQRQLEKMRRQQALLEQQLKQGRVNETTSIPASEVEEDRPDRVPRTINN